MKLLDAREFEIVQKSMLRDVDRISSNSAHGFIFDLREALERARLVKPKVRWRGGDEGLFSVTGLYPGEPADWSSVVLAHLDDVATLEDAVASVDLSSATDVHISFATWDTDIGLTTVRIDALPLAPADSPDR